MRFFTDARFAGLLYLMVVATGIFSIAYVPGRLFAAGDPATTLANIAAHAMLFRAGIAAGIVCYLSFLFLALQFHRLLEPSGSRATLPMAVLAVVSVPMALLNLGHLLDLLDLAVRGGSVEAAAAQLAAYRHGLLMVQLFWGLWLLPLGWLIVRTRAIPRILGVLLMFGFLGYLVRIFGYILIPEFRSIAGIGYIGLPGTIGEIGTCLWLLALGARPIHSVRRP